MHQTRQDLYTTLQAECVPDGDDGKKKKRKRQELFLSNHSHWTRQLTARHATASREYEGQIQKCLCCGASDKKLRKCSRCRRVQYCSKECQRKDWSVHKRACSNQQPVWATEHLGPFVMCQHRKGSRKKAMLHTLLGILDQLHLDPNTLVIQTLDDIVITLPVLLVSESELHPYLILFMERGLKLHQALNEYLADKDLHLSGQKLGDVIAQGSSYSGTKLCWVSMLPGARKEFGGQFAPNKFFIAE